MNDWDLTNIRADIMLATDIEHLQAIDNYYENIVNNLQSRIDKAIEYAKDNLPERDYMGCLLTDEDVTLNMILEKLLDILK